MSVRLLTAGQAPDGSISLGCLHMLLLLTGQASHSPPRPARAHAPSAGAGWCVWLPPSHTDLSSMPRMQHPTGQPTAHQVPPKHPCLPHDACPAAPQASCMRLPCFRQSSTFHLLSTCRHSLHNTSGNQPEPAILWAFVAPHTHTCQQVQPPATPLASSQSLPVSGLPVSWCPGSHHPLPACRCPLDHTPRKQPEPAFRRPGTPLLL